MIEHIESPRDIKSLSISQLNELAKEIRNEIVDVVSKTGGHLSSSLGAVELTIALHRVFDAPVDKIIWDVGHQSYAHKLITGRHKEFHTLRQYGGISGFPSRDESEYDAYNTGHASTSISAALGMAVARDLKGERFKVIAVIGDGALTGGLAYEGLNQTGFMHRNVIIVLNDNGMSISENVGGVATYLNKLVTTPVYTKLKADAWELLGKLPTELSVKARDVARKLKEGLKSFAIPTILFEELGFRYIGPLNGHNIKTLIENFEYIKKLNGPILVHIITEKGKGYLPAMKESSKFHGIGKFDKETGELVVENKKTYTEIFSDAMIEFAAKDPSIVAITAAMPEGTGLDKFRAAFPDRFFDVGIAEQHAITFAAGLALQGLKPVCAIYSTFLQRGFDQILHDICIQRIPIILCLDRAGIVGADGPTHQGTFDLGFLSLLPNLIVAAPKDGQELRNLLYTAINYDKGPMAIRYPRATIPVEDTDYRTPITDNRIEIGEAEVLKPGGKAVILGLGSMVYTALEAVKDLDVEVINARFVKPLDEALLLKIKSQKIITVEENTIIGGFGSKVLEFYNANNIYPKKLLRIGLPDKFIEHGARDILLEKYGLSPDGIRQKVKEFIG
ncbi:MAG: 1-deoxy-D-xylulose-5-phosphate synthase [Candidatus Stahlbacteria bacterium]|nr:1-deoxy-D-xylulose-5-phosphate synthase [Candidatus Stahlbacteria bacterium]